MKQLKFLLKTIFASLTLLLVSCTEETYTFGDIIAPSNIQITAEIVGADANNPFGDGTGVVNFNASASNAITYKYVFNGVESIAPAGTKTFNFSTTGTHKYTVTVVAIGTAGASSSSSVEVEVLAIYAPPADLLTMLTSDSSRTWRVKAEASGHFGVGPADSLTPIWWGADPNQKAGLGGYDDRMVFNVDGTFTYITNGDIYGKVDPLAADFGGDQGLTANSDGEFVNYPAVDFTDGWALSAPGGQETLTFSDKGYHGFYVGGDHSYVILSRSANEMSLRTVGADGLGWFAILVAVN